ncbi:MAG: hypothetical protein IKP32_08115 [Clostridia bacterium]|nr:hypothetical protein [Clostridia bacterium]
MNQTDTISCPEQLTDLRDQLERAYDRRDMKQAQDISRLIDQWQLRLWHQAQKRAC